MKKILFLFIMAFTIQICAQQWTFVEDFAFGKLPHGVVVTPDEKIWIGFYASSDTIYTANDTLPYCPIWIYNPDGSLDRKIQFLTYNTITDTLFDPCRGLSLDNNGNVLFTHWNGSNLSH